MSYDVVEKCYTLLRKKSTYTTSWAPRYFWVASVHTEGELNVVGGFLRRRRCICRCRVLTAIWSKTSSGRLPSKKWQERCTARTGFENAHTVRGDWWRCFLLLRAWLFQLAGRPSRHLKFRRCYRHPENQYIRPLCWAHTSWRFLERSVTEKWCKTVEGSRYLKQRRPRLPTISLWVQFYVFGAFYIFELTWIAL